MEKILIPTDFSEVAGNAALYALNLSRVLNSELIFFHSYKEENDDSQARLETEGKKLAAEDSFARINYVRSGRPFNHNTLKEIIITSQATFVVMGTGGENSLAKKLFGTKTAGIMEGLDRPLIVVPGEYKSYTLKKICYASDLIKIDEEMEQVISFAKRFHAEIVVLHVAPVFPDLGDTVKMDVETKLREISEKHQYNHIKYHLEIMKHDNEITEGLRSFTERENVDLQIMFHNKQTAFDSYFYSAYTENTIAKLEVPLLIFSKPE